MQIKKGSRESQFDTPGADYDPLPESTDILLERTDGELVAPRRRETSAEPEAQARAANARAESVIDVHSVFDGHFETDQDLRVEGAVSGEVVCRGRLTIEREATAKATIQARDAWVKGRVEGDLVCTGKLVLAATAVVCGTIKAVTFVVEEGASVNGTVETLAAAHEAATRAAEPGVALAEAMAAAADAAAAPVAPPSQRWSTRGRDLPSFALVTADERAGERERR